MKILKKSTSYIDFFKKMTIDEVYVKKQALEQCCKAMIADYGKKGEAIIILSNLIQLIIDDIPKRFYVLLKGQVSVLKLRDHIALAKEKELLTKVNSYMMQF